MLNHETLPLDCSSDLSSLSQSHVQSLEFCLCKKISLTYTMQLFPKVYKPTCFETAYEEPDPPSFNLQNPIWSSEGHWATPCNWSERHEIHNDMSGVSHHIKCHFQQYSDPNTAWGYLHISGLTTSVPPSDLTLLKRMSPPSITASISWL